MKKLTLISIFMLLSMVFIQCSDDDNNQSEQTEVTDAPEEVETTVTDADGNIYNTITIGDQVWMLENLKTTKYNDGTQITQYSFEVNGINWGSLNNEEAFYQWADTSDLNNVVEEELTIDAYGAMYNYFAIETGKLAPEGWRIPTVADFQALETFLANDGHTGNQATVLKTTTGWLPSSGDGTNLYGFNAVPNGYVSAIGTSTFANGICSWATKNVNGGPSIGSQTRVLVQLHDEGIMLYGDNAIQIGAGIRCIKE